MANVIYVDGDLFKVGKEFMEKEIKKTGEVPETDETVTEAEAVTNEVSADDTWFKRWKKKRAAKKEAQRKKDEAKGFWQNFFETVLYFAIVILIALSIKKWIGQPVIVSGDSMKDTLFNYNFVWTNKIKYTPERFDVVTLKSKKTNNDMYIKRVVALPGETIYVDLDEKIHIIPEGGSLSDAYVLEDPYGYFDESIHLGNVIINGEVQRQNLSGGVNPRTALGQRADGALLLLVLDGRSINTLGASREDVVNIMLEYGAVNAGNLDGGSSSVMVYNGEIINHCASVTGPRRIPTGFIVLKEGASDG